jgi:hypothetical protein
MPARRWLKNIMPRRSSKRRPHSCTTLLRVVSDLLRLRAIAPRWQVLKLPYMSVCKCVCIYICLCLCLGLSVCVSRPPSLSSERGLVYVSLLREVTGASVRVFFFPSRSLSYLCVFTHTLKHTHAHTYTHTHTHTTCHTQLRTETTTRPDMTWALACFKIGCCKAA